MAHADGADDHEGFASKLIHKEHGDDGEGEVDHAHQRGLKQGGAVAEAGGLENGRRVIHDDIDAGDLLKDRQQDSNDKNAANPGRKHSTNLPRASLRTDSSISFSSRVCLLLAVDAREDFERRLAAMFFDQPARAFGSKQQRNKEQERRDRHDGEHPAPVVVAAEVAQKVIGIKGRRLAEKDGEQVERNQLAAMAWRRKLRDVDGRQHGRGAHGNAGDDAEGDEGGELAGQSAAQRRDEENDQAVRMSVFLRPKRLLKGPASTQPIMQPMMMQLTVQPLAISPRLKTLGLEMYSMTPEMTEVSNPKRNPPVEPTRQTRMR